jgi:hypothetical protein
VWLDRVRPEAAVVFEILHLSMADPEEDHAKAVGVGLLLPWAAAVEVAFSLRLRSGVDFEEVVSCYPATAAGVAHLAVAEAACPLRPAGVWAVVYLAEKEIVTSLRGIALVVHVEVAGSRSYERRVLLASPIAVSHRSGNSALLD